MSGLATLANAGVVPVADRQAAPSPQPRAATPYAPPFRPQPSQAPPDGNVFGEDQRKRWRELNARQEMLTKEMVGMDSADPRRQALSRELRGVTDEMLGLAERGEKDAKARRR